MYWSFNRTDQMGSAVTVSGANAAAMAFGAPVDVKRIIAVVETAVTVAPAEITVQRIPLPSGTANPVTLGVFEVPVSAAGSVFYFDIGRPDADPITPPGPDGEPLVSQTGKPAVVHTAEPPLGLLAPGNQLRVVSDGGSTAGAVIFYAEYLVQGFSGDRVQDAVAV